MPVEWLLVSEGSGFPSSLFPLLHLNSLFWWPCWDPLDNPSQDGQDCHTQNNSGFSSGTAWMHWQNGWYSWLADLLHQSHLGFLDLLPLKTQPLLTLLVYIWVSFSSNASHYGRLSHEGMIVLQIPRGKQVPGCLWLGNIWSSSCGGLLEKEISSFYLSF